MDSPFVGACIVSKRTIGNWYKDDYFTRYVWPIMELA
jgi:hypothetical protein